MCRQYTAVTERLYLYSDQDMVIANTDSWKYSIWGYVTAEGKGILQPSSYGPDRR